MHFEILIEDKSGEAALNELVPKIIGSQHTFKIHSYKGVGHIPKNINVHKAKTSTLLNNLPHLIVGYSKTWGENYPAVLVVVCDLDDKNFSDFKSELQDMLNKCSSVPANIEFCIAIEEGEAWFLGDFSAISKAYPNVKNSVLNSYQNDSICGTWEKLADAIYKGGSAKLKKKSYQEIGEEKSKWAQSICPFMDVDNNSSPSFCYFRDKLREFI